MVCSFAAAAAAVAGGEGDPTEEDSEGWEDMVHEVVGLTKAGVMILAAEVALILILTVAVGASLMGLSSHAFYCLAAGAKQCRSVGQTLFE